MNRRDALKTLAMVPIAGVAAKAVAAPVEAAGGYIVHPDFEKKILNHVSWHKVIRNPAYYAYADVKATPWLRGKVRITCDGQEVKHCIHANAREGYCDVRVQDADGQWVLNADGTAVAEERIYGTVVIERKESGS